MRIYPVFLPHAGCPHRCVFCAQDRSTGHTSVPSLEAVTRFLETSLPAQGDGEIAYFGGSFTALQTEARAAFLELADRFVTDGRVAGIRVSTRPDGLSANQVASLVSAGVTTVEIGCQSFSDPVLAASDRGYQAARIVQAVEACRAADLNVGLQLMPGLPEAGPDEAVESLMAALALKPDFLRIYPTLVIEGTRLAQLWRDGCYRPMTLEQAVDMCADMITLCRSAGVSVIRCGLQGDPALEASLLEGPYHPAFGQLVKSRLWRRALAAVATPGRSVDVCPHDLGDAIGHRRENAEWLRLQREGSRVRADRSIPPGSLRVGEQSWCLHALNAPGRVS